MFRIEDDKTRDYFNMTLAMFEENSNKNIAEETIAQDSKAKILPPCEIDFIKLQEHYCLEVSQCFYSLIALIYLEHDMNYAKMYPILKKVMSSNYMKSYPLKD